MRSALAAVACFALAALGGLLAADVARWPDAFLTGDVRYRVAPEEEGLWRPDQRVPGGLAKRLLAVDDDLELRYALRALRLGRLEQLVVSDPELALRRGEARVRLQAIAAGDQERAIRSRAQGLLGVLSFVSALIEAQERGSHLQEAVRSYEDAIALDPDNAEAKLNLELALQRTRGLEVGEAASGPNPRPGGAGSRGAGAGSSGSGY